MDRETYIEKLLKWKSSKSSYADGVFKVFMLDVGLMAAMIGLQWFKGFGIARQLYFVED